MRACLYYTREISFPFSYLNVLRQHAEWTHLRMAPWPNAVSGRADIALIRPRCSSELPAASLPGLGPPPFVRGAPKRLFLAPQKRPCALAPQKCGAKHGRSQKGCCCLFAMVYIHPCIQSGTFSLRNRASGTAKVFS